MSDKVYEIITETILEALADGVVPWRQPWTSTAAGGHRNATTGRAYTGINPFLLDLAATKNGWTDPRWVSYKQAATLGGNVRKGERSTIITFAKRMEVTDRQGMGSLPAAKPAEKKTKIIFCLRYYRVFNVEQCEGLKLKPLPEAPTATVDVIDQAEAIVAGMPSPPSIRHGGAQAYYRPSKDAITVPARESFSTQHEYYSTLFHELAHSTGHRSRLDRHADDEAPARFGDAVYSREELVAEFGAAFLCGVAGIDNVTVENSAAYIGHWRDVIAADVKLVVQAASKGQSAADRVLGRVKA